MADGAAGILEGVSGTSISIQTSGAAPIAARSAPSHPADVEARDPGAQLQTLTAAVAALCCCPLTGKLVVDPAVAEDGITYERSAIEAWLQVHSTSPVNPAFALEPSRLVACRRSRETAEVLVDLGELPERLLLGWAARQTIQERDTAAVFDRGHASTHLSVASMLRERAEAGSSAARLSLGVLFASGWAAAPPNLVLARAWFARACEHGTNSEAQKRLGKMQLAGIGGAQDLVGGLGLLQDAAEAGDAEARAILAAAGEHFRSALA